MGLIDALLVLAGLGLVGVSAWRRRGGSRAWAKQPYSRNAYLFWLPGFGLVLLGAGLVRLADGGPAGVLGVLAVWLGGLLALWGGLFLPVPAWYLPAWLRPVVARERRDARARRTARRQAAAR